MTVARTGWTTLKGRRRRTADLTDDEVKQARQEERKRHQDAEGDEYDALCEQAWALTDKADALGMRLVMAAGVSPEQFEQVRVEVEEFLADPTLLQNGYAYLGHLQFALTLHGLDTATAQRLPGTVKR